MALTNADFITYGELVSAMFPNETLTSKVDTLITKAATLYPDNEEQQRAYVYLTCYEQALSYWMLQLSQAKGNQVNGSREIQSIVSSLKQKLNKWRAAFEGKNDVALSDVLENVAVWG
jgi:3-phenylpropionate/cinnamic acid dioxygenase small subunit